MANYLILGISLLSGSVGWTLFFVTIYHTYISRKKELELILQIKEDIKNIKIEVNQLK